GGNSSRKRSHSGDRPGCVRLAVERSRGNRSVRWSGTVNVDAIDRLSIIRKRLDADGRVRVTELATELDVSEMTIRRDLETLVDDGLAQRVHGGAVAVGPQQFAARFQQNARAKARLADKLVDLVGTGGAVGIDASSTLQRLATRLGGARDITVLTNGP